MSLEKKVAELKRYVEFGEDDARCLANLHDAIAPDFPRLAREFYDKTREHEEAHAVFSGEEQIARLQQSLQEWLHGLLGGAYDDDYYAQTQRIGEVHVRVGLPQRYILAAMCCLRLELSRLIGERAPPESVAASCAALQKALDLELAVMLDAYHAALMARLEHREQVYSTRGVDLAQAYLAATELTRELMVGVDAEGRVRIFNQGAETATGYRRDEIIDRDFAALLPEESQDRVADVLAEPAPRRIRVETLLRTRGGKLREVRWDVAVTQVGEIRAFFIGHDYTDERILAQRSRRAEKLAAVGTLAAGLAHEIRNPLNGAQLHVAFLERTLTRNKASHDLLEAVGVVGTEIKRLALLVTDFLDFARPNPLDRRPTSLAELVERVAGLAELEAQRAKVTLARDLPSREVIADVDPPKIEQVLLNLVRNAIEALAPEGGGNVTLRLRREPRSGLLEIEDDGPGIPGPNAPIFDAFYTTKPDGTGLGLAITHRIVTDHDGTIEVDSRPGRTVFRVALPLSPGQGGRNVA
jgi:PAS domain S-box-containing protein